MTLTIDQMESLLYIKNDKPLPQVPLETFLDEAIQDNESKQTITWLNSMTQRLPSQHELIKHNLTALSYLTLQTDGIATLRSFPDGINEKLSVEIVKMDLIRLSTFSSKQPINVIILNEYDTHESNSNIAELQQWALQHKIIFSLIKAREDVEKLLGKSMRHGNFIVGILPSQMLQNKQQFQLQKSGMKYHRTNYKSCLWCEKTARKIIPIIGNHRKMQQLALYSLTHPGIMEVRCPQHGNTYDASTDIIINLPEKFVQQFEAQIIELIKSKYGHTDRQLARYFEITNGTVVESIMPAELQVVRLNPKITDSLLDDLKTILQRAKLYL